MRNALTIAVTMGDPGGIGPETALKAVNAGACRGCALVLVGSRRIASAYARHLGARLPQPWESASGSVRPGVYIWDPALKEYGAPFKEHELQFRPGHTGRTNALAAAAWIRAAVDGCLRGVFDAMVTAPICKESFHKAGIPFPGHTEYLAHLTGSSRYAMLLMGGGLRVLPLTRHEPLRRVPGLLTERLLREAIELAAETSEWLELPNKRTGVCALNPHAGDGGLLGAEEKTIINPAVRKMREKGIAVEGPVPADVIFYQALRGRYGIIIAMYHDQGLAPLKMLAFETGVNLTLGLPIIRVSPDHGTAFNIAGRGKANPGSMISAIKCAVQLARRGNPWRNPR